jgi:hypothetical protein
VEALREALRAAGEEREQFTKALEARGGEMRDLEESLEAAVHAQVRPEIEFLGFGVFGGSAVHAKMCSKPSP